MRSLREFLAEMRRLDVKLWAEGDRLRYDAPKGRMSPELLGELKTRKAEVLSFLAKARTMSAADTETIVPISRDRNLALSFAQERQWFFYQLEPDSTAYNIPRNARLLGVLNVALLERSINEIVRRHESLRTRFVIGPEGHSVQIVEPQISISLPLRDLRELPREEREAEARRLAVEDALTPFDLSLCPLFRVQLLWMDKDEYILVFTVHHIVSDEWSFKVFLRELVILYDAYSKNIPAPLADLNIQYADFAHWQREQLRKGVWEGQLAYWEQQLRDIPSMLELPTDRPRPAKPSYRGDSQSFELPVATAEALQSFNREERATMFMTLLAAFNVLLYRYSSQTDITVGFPVANRNRFEVEPLIGFLVNTLVLRTRLTGNQTFRELLRNVRDMSYDAQANQDIPFEKIVAALHPKREVEHNRLFQVMFVWQDEEDGKEALPGLRILPFKIDDTISPFELVLTAKTSEHGLSGKLYYRLDLFESETILRMVRHFKNIVEAIAENPELRISEIPLLSETERRQLLVEWNKTQRELPENLCIHRLFEQQAAHTPDAPAVIFGAEELSYQELNQQANQLAHHLQKRGVGPDVLVGISMERSLQLVVAILGVLKAGGAYVPLDPSYPKDRLVFMIEDSQIQVLLTQEALLSELPECNASILCVDRDRDRLASECRENPESPVTIEHLAYVIYTSGSTGRPKGVLVTHRGLPNLCSAQIQAFGVRPESRVLQFASFSFDASVSEIFVTFLAGATLVLAPREALFPGPTLSQTLRDYRVTVVTLPPSALAVMDEKILPGLQTVVSAGEACSSEIVSRWSPGRRFLNAYGPTEATVCATIQERVSPLRASSIGRAIANTHIYIVDASLQPVPIGVAGELCVAGIGLAKGYLNQPELTAEKFVPNPFCQTFGAQLYRTGDRARYLPDGEIEFLGRLDHQVKIRGFRIELGEIEETLAQHPDIQNAVVVAKTYHADDIRLVAYLVSKQTAPAPISAQPAYEPVELWPSVAEFFVYDELLYHAMTNDELRNKSYKVAMRQTVKDKVVVDIGTGKDAILSRFCVEAGAKKVYAIERGDEAYREASARIKELGLSDKIVLIHGDATLVELPELADVCVSEIVGPIGGCEGAAVIINNSRRLLKPDGVMLPHRSMTKIAAVRLPEEILHSPRFTQTSGHYAQKIFEQIGYPFDVRLCIRRFPESHILSNEEIFEDLNFSEPVETDHHHDITLTITQDSLLHGFLVWLNLETIQGEVIDILEQEYCWLPVYFPVFDPGIEVSSGDRIEAVCARKLCENGLNPDYFLTGRIIRRNGEVVEFTHQSFHHKQVYKQHPFYDRLFSDSSLETGFSEHEEHATDSLKQYLRERLPEYMIPSTFISLEALPLTPNGKVDRRSLPEPDAVVSERATTFIPPRTSTEKTLAAIWEEVLKIKQIGRHDKFFDIGGHSLLAVQTTAKMSTTMRCEISVQQLFQHPTIAQLAKMLEECSKPCSEENVSLESGHSQGCSIENLELFHSPFFQCERRPLLPLMLTEKIPPVDAAALSYLDPLVYYLSSFKREEIIHDWCQELPMLSHVYETKWGRVAHLFLPRFATDLYADQEDAVAVSLDALKIAGAIGAKVVSLTGIIPSATDYGRAIVEALKTRPDLPQITTGHGTTCATVVLTIKQILEAGGRKMPQERVGFLGLGSVGISVLHLMLESLPHPEQLLLCDVYAKQGVLESIRQELRHELGFEGNIRVIASQKEVPEEFYDASLIVGATNVPDVLDVERLKPGTMIVDDSGPHCFRSGRAVVRFEKQQDILFSEGGMLQTPDPLQELHYIPPYLERAFTLEQLERRLKRDPAQITGCILSSILSARFEELPPTVGMIETPDALRHYEKLLELGCRAADLRCEHYGLPEELIAQFRQRFHS